jgi:hypothetical protein
MTISLTLPPHHRYTTPPPKNLHHTFLLHSQVMCPPITLIVHHHPSNHPSFFTHTIVTIPHKPQGDVPTITLIVHHHPSNHPSHTPLVSPSHTSHKPHYHIHLSTQHFILPFTSHHTFHSHLTTLLSPLRLVVRLIFQHSLTCYPLLTSTLICCYPLPTPIFTFPPNISYLHSHLTILLSPLRLGFFANFSTLI